MLKNVWNRIISVILVLAMISCISLPQVQVVYATYQQYTEDTIYSENFTELTDTEKNVSTFEYDGIDFSVKVEINANNLSFNMDDIQLVVSTIDETDERYGILQQINTDNTQTLLLYDMNFYTRNGEKVDVSNCDSRVVFYFVKPFINCKSDEINVMHFTETSLNSNEKKNISFNSTDIQITGTTFVNDELTDISFNTDSFSVYGILIPKSDTEQSIQTTSEDLEIPIYQNSLNMLTIGTSSSETITVHKIEDFTLSLTNGATLNDYGQYVWTPTTSNEGHGFTYKLVFSISGEGDLNPETIEIRIPKQILRNSSGDLAGEIILPYPAENESYDKNVVDYVYKEDAKTGEIVIYNIKNVSAGTLEIPFMYETTEKTWEYEDMESSIPCVATVTVKSKDASGNTVNIEAETDKIPVYVDTNVKIQSTSKSCVGSYEEWNDSWGLTKPDDADNYVYFIWKVSSNITNITQKYDFYLIDNFYGLTGVGNNSLGEVVGYKMQEDTVYSYASTDDSTGSPRSPTAVGLTASSRTDYVLTRYPKNALNTDEKYKLENSVTTTVTPTDGKDESTNASATANYTYEEPQPIDPIYSPPGESYTISKYGIYGAKNHVTNSNQISSYALEDLKGGKDLSGLMYHIQADAYAYIRTLSDGATGIEQDANDGKFGQKSITYSISDSEIFLNDSTETLSKDDYTFTSLEYNVKMQYATYNKDTLSFDTNNVTAFRDEDILTFYVMTEDDEEYIPVAIYQLSDGTTWIDDKYISSLTSSSISFKDDVKGWKIETSNPYYSTTFNIYPTITLKSTQTVRETIGEDKKISVQNKSVLKTFDSEDNLIKSRFAAGTDYVAEVQRNSTITKNFANAKNYTGQRYYKVNWATSINETYTDDEGTFPVRQESGVFYDLLPVGCRVDINSIKVYADGIELAEGEYIIDETIENYKDSNRTLITIRINVPAETTDGYKMTYTTVHTWEDILDYGRYVLNSVAYETGNEDIANGYPDNGGNISDSTILEDLDPDSNDKCFLYSQATHSINALIPYSSGITKKVASADDAVFSNSTIVHQDSDYTYSIRMENSSLTSAKDIIILDSLEKFCNKLNGETVGEECDWYGTLVSFGLSNLKSKGIEPVIYLSTTENIDLQQYATSSASDFFEKLSNDSDWVKQENFNGKLSDVKAFAIDLTTKTDGTPFILEANESFSFTVTMHSPSTINSDDINLETYNNIYRSFISIDNQTNSETYFYTHYDYTTVTYRTVGTLHFKKIYSDTKESIQGIKFNLSGTSDYGTEVNKDIVTNSSGEIYLPNLERGKYLLKETYSTPDYLLGRDRTVIVDSNGNVTITPNDGTNTDKLPLIENTPRIHGDLNFLKRDTLNPDKPVNGAVFTLTGTSDYGNKIDKTAISNVYGVTFEDVEMGTYTLTEISAPDDYVKLTTKYTVVCNKDGILSIKELSPNDDGNYIITNMPRQSFNIRKIDAVNNEKLQYAEFTLTSNSTESGEVIVKENITSDMFGIAEFSGLDLGTYTLRETTAPKNHILDTTEYTVEIKLVDKQKVVIINDSEGNSLEVEEDTGYFLFPNEREYNGRIKIIKKWVDDSDNEHRPTPVIHLSTEEPEVNNYKATINNISELKKQLISGNATSIQRDKWSPEAVILEKYDNGTAWKIGDGSNVLGADNEKDVYLYSNGTDYYIWSEAETVFLPDNCTSLFGERDGSSDICKNLITADLSQLDFSKITNTFRMFQNCSALESITFPTSIDTNNLINMQYMFYGCKALTNLDLSGFNTENVTNMYGTFQNSNGLENITLGDRFSLNSVTTMRDMFNGCTALASLDCTKFGKALNLQNVQQMFQNCALREIDLTNLETDESLINIYEMFGYCSNLEKVMFGNKLNTSRATSLQFLFYGCSSLQEIEWGSFTTSSVTNMQGTFQKCTSLTELDINMFTTSSVITMKEMFSGCSNLQTIYVSPEKWSTTACTNSDGMFSNCSQLVGGNNTKQNVDKVTNGLYARIDDPPDNPGYLTNISQKPSTTSTTQLTELVNTVSDTLKVSTAVVRASFAILLSSGDNNDEDTSTNSSVTTADNITEYISNELLPNGESVATVKQEDDTWIYEFSVYDDEAKYYVWEDLITDYKSDTTKNEPKIVNADGSITKIQTITNAKDGIPEPEVGNLTLSKKVTKDGVAVTDDTTVFTFKITLTDANGTVLSGTQYFSTTEFVDGEATVKLTSQTPITISDIPVGTLYSIEEIDIPYGYESKMTSPVTDTIKKDTTLTVDWENSIVVHDTGTFHVSKTVELITENQDETEDEPQTIALTTDEQNQEFTFTAILSNLDRSAEYTIQKGEETLKTFSSDTLGNATVSFTLKHDEMADFIDIPIGATYQITETIVDEYTTSYTLIDANNSSGGMIESSSGSSATDIETLDVDEDVTVAFTNSKTINEEDKRIQITVEKCWEDDTETQRPESITVHLERGVKLFSNSDTLYNQETYEIATITADDNGDWKIVFTDLPKYDDQKREYVYSVKEETVVGYNCAITQKLDTFGNQSFIITNTKQPTCDLTISKTVTGVLGNKAKQFEFTITLTDSNDKPLNGFYTLLRDNAEILALFDVNGTAKIGLSHGETATIKNLPQGTKFTISETDYSKDGYTTRSSLTADNLTDSSIVNGELDTDKSVVYENTRDGILPTGIVTNIIPLIIVGIFSLGAIALLKRKMLYNKYTSSTKK